MSISLSAYGIHVDEILSMFGSKKSEHIAALKDKLRDDQISVLEKAVMNGVPFSGLHEESWSHVLLMKKLFEGAGNQTWGDVTFGYTWLVEMLVSDFIPELDMNSRELMSYFVDGRPIFGNQFGETEALYGYLSAEEVKALNKSLARFKLPPPGAEEWDDLPLEMLDAPYSEFTSALTELLPHVIDKKQGLAIYVT